MRLRMILLCGLWLLLVPRLTAQEVRLRQYTPADYLADNRHEVILFNAGSRPANLGLWLVVTRDYAVRLPPGTQVPPQSSLLLKKRLPSGQPGINLGTTPDFFIRFRNAQFEGNYVALLNPSGKIVDAFYFAPLRNTPFLPDVDTLITFDRRLVTYSLPSERSPVWSFVPTRELGGLRFRHDGQKWSILGEEEALAPRFQSLIARYREGIVHLRWGVEEADSSFVHVVERSQDQQSYEEIGRIPARGGGLQQYDFYETEAAADTVYFYRIRAEGNRVEGAGSNVAALRTEEGRGDFQLEVFRSEGRPAVRVFSRYSQRLRVKVLDERRREVAFLFDDFVYAETLNLLRLTRELPPGRYLIVADTEGDRYAKEWTYQPGAETAPI